ncbi:MAG: hypothetical protein IPP66_09045 [Anaerolineales bacterium]|nr:hypothetical protein [Anaerolineales bacterium]
MSRTPQYEKLLAELKAGKLPIIERKILDALYQAPNGLTRRELVRIVFGQEAHTNLGNDTKDRKIRKAIESLRNRGIPIVSNSGKAGYKLDTNPENIACIVRELKSRINHLQQRVDAISSYYELFVRVPDANRMDG